MESIIERLRFGCPFKPGTLGEKDAEAAERVMAEAADEIERLRAALTEARRWIGDGEFSDGLHHDYWTPEYRAGVAMVDAALVQNAKVSEGENGK